MFNNRSLQGRIISAFMFVGFIVLIVGMIGWVSTSSLGTKLTTVSTNSQPAIEGLWKIKEGQTQIESSEGALLDPLLNANERQEQLARINSALQQIDEGFKQYEPTYRSEEEEKIYKQLVVKWDKWRQDQQEFVQLNQQFESLGILNPQQVQLDLIAKGQENTPQFAAAQAATNAFNKLHQKSKANRVSFKAATESILEDIKLNEDVGKKAYEEGQQNIAQSRFWVILGMTIGPLTALIFGIYFSNTIAKPLGAKIAGVVTIAEKISVGDLTSQVQVTEEMDEIGQLLAAFRQMSLNLNSLIRLVQQSGIQITTSTTQIAASGKQLEATVTEQAASANEVLATTNEISATSKELVQTMDRVAELSQATATSAGGGQKDLIRMENTMRNLANSTNSISTKLGVITEKANNINSVVTTITKVADQTNLLSLNAAIEAEKAGEYGTGFAVVAREIRRLADQTAVATLDIENMVKEMQAAVSTGVMEMDKFTKEVFECVEDVGNISVQLGSIIQQVQSLTPRFQVVNQGMDAQVQGAEQIKEAMVQLSEASSQTADSLREINRAISQLNEASQGLRQEISRFKVN
ncbi:methyl-accepting chemotaxis protein [Argonema antarcticum]|uniref:methyl-accepting chemotaxis protein n=1 Tax=Argonema antarcticum TaxID=2942763 RepID=UPI00201267A6|nr:methyl-accepting chemotaxis protein [Argonema antarcticum]MCL1471725.1 methyl-accepting chemotaxis protein [Argonema antarcticum A004/B2]